MGTSIIIMTNIHQIIENFDWNHVEEVGEDEIHLIDQDRVFSPVIKISKQQVLDQHQPETHLVGMVRSDWDDYREIYRTFQPEELWEDQKYSMIQNAWDRIERTWMNEFEEIIKIEKPC